MKERGGKAWFPPGKEAPLLEPEELESRILAHTEELVVVDKPGWLVCHPSKNGPWSSLVGAVREWLGEERIHLVSRLDRETSGVVVLARNRRSARALQQAFSARRVKKHYHALLAGKLEEEVTTESNLEKDPENPVVVAQRVSFGGRGKAARTRFRPLEYWGGCTLAEVSPETGRKHQIRVHAAWLGHPVAGDKIYGGDPRAYLDFIESGWTAALRERLCFPRQALHAAELAIQTEAGELCFSAPCPFVGEGFRELAEAMGSDGVTA